MNIKVSSLNFYQKKNFSTNIFLGVSQGLQNSHFAEHLKVVSSEWYTSKPKYFFEICLHSFCFNY